MSIVFFDGFETGDFSAWDNTPGDPPFAVNMAAAKVGTYGCEIDASGAGAAPQVAVTFNPAVGQFRLGCWFNLNDYDTSSSFGQLILGTSGTTFGAAGGAISIVKTGGDFYVIGDCENDAGASETVTSANPLSPGWHTIELVFNRATNSGSADGTGELFIDGVSEGTIPAFDNYDAFADVVALEINRPSGSAGTSVYMDNVTLRDDTTPIFAEDYGPAAMSKPADIDGAGEYIYIAALSGGAPVLLKLSTDLNANATQVFAPGSGSDIGVECGRQDSQVVWVGGEFDGTNTVEKSDDAGATFTPADDGSFAAITAFEVGPGTDDNRVLAVDSTPDAYETFDSGGTWFARGASISAVDIHALRRLGPNPDEVLIGGDDSELEYSPNALVSVEDVSNGLPAQSYKVTSIIFE